MTRKTAFRIIDYVLDKARILPDYHRKDSETPLFRLRLEDPEEAVSHLKQLARHDGRLSLKRKVRK